MHTYKKHKLRVISGLLSASMALSSIGYAAPLAPIPSDILMSKIPMSQFALDPSKVDLPLEHVTLKEIHKGTSGKLIIHIQDAHANLSGQKSLSNALDSMMNKYQLNLVMVEGSARDSSLHKVRKLAPLKEWAIIARRFLFDGIISGEEFLNLTTEHDMRIVGVEYRDLYDDAIKAYAALVDQRKDILHYLYRSKQAVDKLKQRLYPIALIGYEMKKRQNEEDGGDFKVSFEALMDIADDSEMNLENYPEIRKLKQMHETERAIDFNEANKEQIILMRQLKDNGAESDVKEFMKSSQRVRNVQVSQYLLMRRVLAVAEERRLDLKSFPQLTAYVNYLKSFTDLELEKLLNEIDLLEDKSYMAILKEDEAKKVRAIDRFLGLLGNAYKLQMSSNEFKMLKFNESDFPTEAWLAFLNQQLVEFGFFEQLMPYKAHLETARESLGEFYTLVDKRDEAFVQNAKRIMKDSKEDAAVLIAGGYHTAHLTELLREENFSYMVLTPVVTDKTDHDKYEKLLLAYVGKQEQKINEASGAFSAQNVAITKAPRGIRMLSLVSQSLFAGFLKFLSQSVRTDPELAEKIADTLAILAQETPESVSPEKVESPLVAIPSNIILSLAYGFLLPLSSMPEEALTRFEPYFLQKVADVGFRLDIGSLTPTELELYNIAVAKVPANLKGEVFPLRIERSDLRLPKGHTFELIRERRSDPALGLAASRLANSATDQEDLYQEGIAGQKERSVVSSLSDAFRILSQIPVDSRRPVHIVFLTSDIGGESMRQRVETHLGVFGELAKSLVGFGGNIDVVDDSNNVIANRGLSIPTNVNITGDQELQILIRASALDLTQPKVVFVASQENLTNYLEKHPELKSLVEPNDSQPGRQAGFIPIEPLNTVSKRRDDVEKEGVNLAAIGAALVTGQAPSLDNDAFQGFYEDHKEYLTNRLDISNAEELSFATDANPFNPKYIPLYKKIRNKLPTLRAFVNTRITRLLKQIAAVASSA